jgi:type II secretory pathway predicted ATPase ExeA
MNLIENHFNLHSPPFPQAPDPEAILHHASLKSALERLRFSVDRDGIALLSAESGCGKSTVLGCFNRDLDPTKYMIIYSSLATVGPFGLIAFLATRVGVRIRRSKSQTAQDLVSHLRALSRRTVVVVDEAHRMPDDTIEDLRLLTADSADKKSPFTLILGGQPALRERMSDPEHYALKQRITVRVRLSPLTEADTTMFIDKHMRACGAQRAIFDPEAVQLLFQHSRGIPRLIQSLALSAMLACQSALKKTVDTECVQQALLEQEGL